MTAPVIAVRKRRADLRRGQAAVQALAGVNFEVHARRVRRGHGAERVGQVHGDEHPRLPRPADRRRLPLSRRRRRSARRASSARCCAATTSASCSRVSTCSPAPPRSRTSSCRWSIAATARASGAQRAREALAAVGLDRVGVRTRPPSSRAASSSAWRSRGRIVTEPSVLFADEPTGNLDTARSVEIMELLVGFNASAGITIAAWSRTSPTWRRMPRGRFASATVTSRATSAAGGGPLMLLNATPPRASRDPAQRAALVADHARHHHRRRLGDHHGHARQRRHGAGTADIASMGSNLLTRDAGSTRRPWRCLEQRQAIPAAGCRCARA